MLSWTEGHQNFHKKWKWSVQLDFLFSPSWFFVRSKSIFFSVQVDFFFSPSWFFFQSKLLFCSVRVAFLLSPSCFFVRSKLLFMFDSSYFILFLIFFFFNTEIKHTEDGSGEVFKHYTQRWLGWVYVGVFLQITY